MKHHSTKNISLLIIIFFLHSTLHGITQQQSMHPPSTWDHGIPIAKQDKIKTFIHDTNTYALENKKIPTKTPAIFRIMTYNIHNWKDPQNRVNYNNILNTIKKINPDVLILQEVTTHEKLSYTKIYNDMHAAGFSFQTVSCNTFRKKFLGNVIFTKKAPQSTQRGWFKKQERPYQEDRCWVSMEFKLPGGKPLTLYGTHLEVGQKKNYSQEKKERIRQTQIQELIDHAKKGNRNALIAADFNALRKEDHQHKIGDLSVWDILKKEWHIDGEIPTYTLDTLKKEGFKDSFTYLGWQNPKFTVWSGIAIDFMFLAPTWNLPLAGTYVYYDAASDHLPIIMDIKV